MTKIAKELLTINVNRVSTNLEIPKLGKGIIAFGHPFLPKTIFSRYQNGGIRYAVKKFIGFTRMGKYKYEIYRLDQKISSIDKKHLTPGEVVYRVGGISYLAPIPHVSTPNNQNVINKLDAENNGLPNKKK